ncbi:MAG: ABC transporter substrate-binding protein, partial [Betaproteobacteria bacterium]|nr:ABC transporter substrate-binding protein [Betaproteobacteria bacterium]
MGPPFVAPQEHAGLPPEAFVQAVTGDAFATACTNRTVLADNERNAQTLVGSSLRRYFDFNRITRQVIGSDWEKASDEQRKKLTDGFRSLLVRDWASSVFQHCDWIVEVSAPHADPDARDVMVSTVMHRAGMEAVTVDYSLERRAGKKESAFSALVSFVSSDAKDQQAAKDQDLAGQTWRVFDIAVNGQSL